MTDRAEVKIAYLTETNRLLKAQLHEVRKELGAAFLKANEPSAKPGSPGAASNTIQSGFSNPPRYHAWLLNQVRQATIQSPRQNIPQGTMLDHSAQRGVDPQFQDPQALVLKAEIVKLRTAINTWRSKCAHARGQLSQRTRYFAQAKTQAQTTESALRKELTKLQQAKEHVQRNLMDKLAELQRQMVVHARNVADYESRLAASTDQRALLKQRLEALTEQNEQLEGQLCKKQSQLEKLSIDLETMGNREAFLLKSVRGLQSRMHAQQNQWQEATERFQRDKDQTVSRVEQLEMERETLRHEIAEQKAKVSALSSDLDEELKLNEKIQESTSKHTQELRQEAEQNRRDLAIALRINEKKELDLTNLREKYSSVLHLYEKQEALFDSVYARLQRAKEHLQEMLDSDLLSDDRSTVQALTRLFSAWTEQDDNAQAESD